MISIPPEILFHRFFQSAELGPRDRELYRGKQDLENLPPDVRSLLDDIQEHTNESLRQENQNVPEHVDHPPFHFDYIESSVPNALAFRYEGYSFIGVTISLIYVLWDVCIRLSRSEGMATLAGVGPSADDRDMFHVVLYRILLSFVVAHEYTHHVHGHVCPREPGATLYNEILSESHEGGLDQQTLEVAADGYAAYLCLANLIDGEGRTKAIALLKLAGEPESAHDRVLLSCFVTGIGGYLLNQPAAGLDSVKIYRLTHPPQAARINCFMFHVIGWCKQYRPDLKEWMTLDRFQKLMIVTAEATLGAASVWIEQTAFLKSETGSEYFRELDKKLKVYISSL